MRGASRLPTFIGRILIAVGFVMILFAWEGAAGLDYITGQFPYLLSGAIPGLALIIIGAGLEYVQAVRQFTAQRARQMAELNLAVVKLIGYVKETGGLIPGPDSAPTTAAQRSAAERLAALDSSMHAFDKPPGGSGAVATAPPRTAQAAPPAAAPRAASQDRSQETVVAGRSSFHDPECHLVTGRDDMTTITRLEAEGQGLSPCRVCKP
jgi:hypothetical protein